MALDWPDDDFARPEVLQGVIDASCTSSAPDTCTPAAANILAIFDSNGDLKITLTVLGH